MNVIYDVETTGLPQKDAEWRIDYMRFPHIVQFSWKRSDKNDVRDYIIKPDGYTIPIESTKVHGISQEKAFSEGHPIEAIIMMFLDDAIRSEKMIAHNGYFDSSLIKANVLRLIRKKNIPISWRNIAERALDKSKRIDTMKLTTKWCNIPFPNGKGTKWPTLVELYDKLFPGETFPAHDSKEDVIATDRCYIELIRRGIIK